MYTSICVCVMHIVFHKRKNSIQVINRKLVDLECMWRETKLFVGRWICVAGLDVSPPCITYNVVGNKAKDNMMHVYIYKYKYNKSLGGLAGWISAYIHNIYLFITWDSKAWKS